MPVHALGGRTTNDATRDLMHRTHVQLHSKRNWSGAGRRHGHLTRDTATERREWDLNPRWVAPRRFSRPVHSAALSSLHQGKHPTILCQPAAHQRAVREEERRCSVRTSRDCCSRWSRSCHSRWAPGPPAAGSCPSGADRRRGSATSSSASPRSCWWRSSWEPSACSRDSRSRSHLASAAEASLLRSAGLMS